eukprot:m.114993 g.114993  ORF g.114993 m.114993 type:complete len:372 (-) comp16042_c0_seq2:2864-3979(-)
MGWLVAQCGRPREAVLDGGLSSLLEERGHPMHRTLWSAALLANPAAHQAIIDAHLTFLNSGADIIETLTYQATARGFVSAGLCATPEEADAFLTIAINLADKARKKFLSLQQPQQGPQPELPPHLQHPPPPYQPLPQAVPVLPTPRIAGSIGPYGAFLANGEEFVGNYGLSEDELMAFHRPKVLVLTRDSRVDVLAFETVPELAEARAIVRLMAAVAPTKPFWLSFQCRDGLHLASGVPLADAVREVLDLVVSSSNNSTSSCALIGIGVNCVKPEFAASLCTIISKAIQTCCTTQSHSHLAGLDILCYANKGGVYDGLAQRWSTPEGTVLDRALLSDLRAVGVTVYGGCCRVHGPEIAGVAAFVRGEEVGV